MRSNFLKLFFLGVIIFTTNISLSAQQYTLNGDRSKVSLLIDNPKANLRAAEMESGKRGLPLREAKFYKLDMSMDTIGVWSVLPTKKNIWKLNIDVPRAKGFFLSLDDFYLPPGTQLFVYNENTPEHAVVYTHEDNPQGGPYSIENLSGDNVVLEYVTSDKTAEQPRLHLLNVGYKYIDDYGQDLSVGGNGFNDPKNVCMINVNCPEGQPWQDQKKGIMRLRINTANGSSLCSATLINNTSEDKTPYVLTAYHCFENATVSEIENSEFFFEYETPSCNNTAVPPPYKYHKGAEVLVLNPISTGSDGALLKLTGKIPDSWDVYFNGWDRENKAVGITSGAVIHHPCGDVKKISLYDQNPISGTWSATSPKGSHWIVKYSKAVTEGGSSGAPLFNQDKLVIGTLTGGNSKCSSPNEEDYYGKMWYHWDQYPQADKHMNVYLDPENTGVTKLAGINNNDNADKALVVDNSVIYLLQKTSVEVNIISGNGGYKVASSDENIASACVGGNKIVITGINYGSATITLTDIKNKKVEIQVSVHRDVEIALDANNMLNIKIFKEGDTLEKVRIIDLDGDVFYNKRNLPDQTLTRIDVSNFHKGVYVIEVKTHKGGTKSQKIIW